jgi:hypothetical protein
MRGRLSQKDRRMLGTVATYDDAGRHFTERYPADWLQRMEDLGYITIFRPIHGLTGIPYGPEYWRVQAAPVVAEWFDSYGNLITD